MGENKWSAEQERVINDRTDDLLVSAAAGAGKTAVLVEHILGLVTSGVTDIDRMLIVTFTNAAAGEMRDRIGRTIASRAEEDPSDKRLHRQQMLIHNASIMTIDSFCLSVVREFFHEIDLDPSFRIAQNAELELLKQDTMDEMMEKCYAAAEPGFMHVIECLGDAKGDSGPVKAILNISRCASAHPDPEAWLNELKTKAVTSDMEDDTAAVMWHMGQYLDGVIAKYDELLLMGEHYEGLAQAARVLTAEQDHIRHLRNATEQSYEDVLEVMAAERSPRLSWSKDITVDEEAKAELIAQRKKLRDDLKKELGKYFSDDSESMREEYELTGQLIGELTDLAALYLRMFGEKKREKNLIDFNDLEHFALQILTKDTGDRSRGAAAELRRRYDKIFVDEYQDSNMIQECITEAIADKGPGSPVTFMVGDVKQSIYRFRMAKPELFIARMRNYLSDSPQGVCINLHSNYRSRKTVLDSTNDVFLLSMKEPVGGITYDTECALNAGLPQEDDAEGSYRTEVIVVDPDLVSDKDAEGGNDGTDVTGEDQNTEQSLGNNDEADDEQDQTLCMLEARAVAHRIKKLVADRLPVRAGRDPVRPVALGDIVILLRSLKDQATVYREILEEEGIPSFSDVSSGFLDTTEIGVMLDMLRILDNPAQDIPYTAVLHSPIVGLTADELAQIRIAGGMNVPMCDAVRSFSGDAAITARLKDFLRMYDTVGKMSRTRDIDRLLGKIYEMTGFYTYCTAMPGGARRAANLDLLLDYAAEYEASSYSGLFSFVRYIEQLKDAQLDLEEASGTEAVNAVRIMTIHKSKGLEFPVVIVGGMGKSLQNKDVQSAVVVSPDHGIGVPAVDLEIRTQHKSRHREVLALRMKRDALGEEQRLLYVAMTRAKEKLIMIGTSRKSDGLFSKWEKIAGRTSDLTYSEIMGAKSYLDWVCPAAIRCTERFTVERMGPDELRTAAVEESSAENDRQQGYLEASFETIPREDFDPGTVRRFGYGYPHQDISVLPMKLSVSDLKKQQMVAEYGYDIWENPDPKYVICPEAEEETETAGSGADAGVPAAAQPDDSHRSMRGGAEVGTLYHKVLQLIPLSLCETDGPDEESRRRRCMAEVAKFLDELVAGQVLTYEESRSLSWDRIAGFLTSALCRRMRNAEQSGTLRREQPFVLGVAARDISPAYSDYDEMIPVQGVIDCLFEEDGGIVVVDYKTDHVGPGCGDELVKRYRAQLDYYAEAAQKLLGRPVREKLIYSVGLGETITL